MGSDLLGERLWEKYLVVRTLHALRRWEGNMLPSLLICKPLSQLLGRVSRSSCEF